MKTINKIITISLSVILLISCSEFDKINTNPDKPLDATAGLMATRLIWNMAGPDAAKTFSYDYQRGKYLGWSEGASNEQYNFFGRISFNYSILTTGKKMVAKAQSSPQSNSYEGLFKFLKAYKLFHLSMKLGDIPYAEALNGEEGIVKPKYDTQKEVFLQILDDLDEAYTHFENAGKTKFDGDIIYNGDNSKWQMMISAFQMKVLLSMSKKETDTDLNIKKRFQDIVSKQKMFTSNDDNFQLVYKNQSGMINPFHHTQTKHAAYALISTVLIDSLKKYEDYRMFYYASPAEYNVTTEGKAENSWDAFEGVDITLPFSQMGNIASQNKCSRLNKRYTDTEQAEPFAKMRYSDMNFYLAEASLRGWINGDYNTYYLKAIEADMKFKQEFMIDDVKYHYGRLITDQYISDYLAKQEIQLVGTFQEKLNKLITQKYLSNFLQVYELDAYMEYRRTGYPVFPINPSTNLNLVTDKVPVRFMYPTNEMDYNTDNVMEAINRQFNGNDEVNELMWILR